MSQECPGHDLELEIHEIPVSKIYIGQSNARKHAIDRDLQELADSIKKHGQLQPIVLRGTANDSRHELMIGQRRFLAIRDILNRKTIKATFVGNISNLEAFIRSLAENMARSELSYEDASNAVTQLYTKHFNRDDRRVAKETGISLKKVRQLIYIEERASEKTKQRLRKKEVAPADVQRALRAAAGNIDKADELLELMKKHSFDKPQKERMVDFGRANPRASANEIINRSLQPAIERIILVRLHEKAREGLISASKEMNMAPDEVASLAVEEWLASKGFLI
jgi:ParB family chromosome partitioning protein